MGYPNARNNPDGAIPIYIVPTPAPGPPWPSKQNTGAIPISMGAAPTTPNAGAIPVWIVTGPNAPDAEGRWPNDQHNPAGAIPAYYSAGGMPVWDAGGPAPINPPVNTVPPLITPAGPAIVGTLLTMSNGTWTNSPTSYIYNWRRNSTGIVGETANTYTTVAADVGTVIDGVMLATNSVGPGLGIATSNQVTVT
jgi:hypothetical protein